MSWSWLWTALSLLNYALALVAAVSILRRPREPRAMFAWILALLLLPFVGLLAYLLAGDPRFKRTRRKRHRRQKRISRSLRRQIEAMRKRFGEDATEEERALAEIAEVAVRTSDYMLTTGNQVDIYFEDDDNFNAIMEAVRGAKSHIHLEYYIYQPDETGRQLRDALIAKAKEGVEVRLLVDFVGTFNWTRSFRRTFTDHGIQVASFLPAVPWGGRWRVNFRNHRKIVVVDGHVGFTGGQNIGDEYRGRREKFGPFRDTHMRIEGPAVQQLQEIFVEDWNFTRHEDLSGDEYFPNARAAGEQTVQVIPSGPDRNPRIMHHVLLAAVASARESIAIITPYFVPDSVIVVALQSAAYRGVRVQLLVPATTDHRIVLWAGRSYYQELTESGVEIYEYDHALLHSKVMMVDNNWGMVGSANMDQRSFRINFEVTALLYDHALACHLREDFEALLKKARRVRPESPDHWTFGESVKLGLARLLSPLL